MLLLPIAKCLIDLCPFVVLQTFQPIKLLHVQVIRAEYFSVWQVKLKP